MKNFLKSIEFDAPWALLFFSVIALLLTFSSCGPCASDIKATYETKTVLLEIHKASGTSTIQACTRVPRNGQPDVHGYSFNITNETLYGFWHDPIDVNVLSYRILGVVGEQTPQEQVNASERKETTHYSIYHIDLPTDYANISKDASRPTLLNAYILNDTLFIKFR